MIDGRKINKNKFMEKLNQTNMELDEIDRLISKRTWERFQTEMEKLEYIRRNSDLEHRIKILHIQLNVPKVTITKNIPCHSTINSEIFEIQMRDAIQLNELRREKISSIEQNYHRRVKEIHANSNEIIGMFENLEIIKNKRYFENEIHSVRQHIYHLENKITISKQQLNENQYNQQRFFHNFILNSVIHWKSISILHEQIQNHGHRLNELSNEIGVSQNDVTIMENRVAEVRKVYEQLKVEMELKQSQVPRVIDKLPITYFEQNEIILDSPSSDSSRNSIADSNPVHIIDNVLIKSADLSEPSQNLLKVNECTTNLDDNGLAQEDDGKSMQIDKKLSQKNSKTEKPKTSNKRSNTADDDNKNSLVENRSLRKKSRTVTDRAVDVGKSGTVDVGKSDELNVENSYLEQSPRKLRNNKILPSDPIPLSQKRLSHPTKANQVDQTAEVGVKQSVEADQSAKVGADQSIEPDKPEAVRQLSQISKNLSPKKYIDPVDLDNLTSKCSSPTFSDPNISFLPNFQKKQFSADSFTLNNTSDQESRCTSVGSKDDDFFITNEGGDGFDFFQNNNNDQLFS